ncbi:MAG TPA: MscL family protein [Holophagaceae bacterium]|nr:MscL family protein [Holophagaceae bacterium]
MSFRGWRAEFRRFVSRGNVLDFIMAFVMGVAFGKIITAVVDGLVMPVLSYWVPEGQWDHFLVGKFKVGIVAGAIVEFLATAVVLFVVLVKLGPWLFRRGGELASDDQPTKLCPECRMVVPAEARRCGHCTSRIGEAPPDPFHSR